MISENGLNKFIENYLKNDKSQRALMLTAPWGTGKSFYIKNNLCPYLKSKKLDFAIVSLYGITNIRDISKNIYLEIRAKKLISKKSEKSNVARIVGKTIAKGIASYFNVNLNQGDDDWQRLYESIDLSNKLIILEDLERANLDIVEVMGFVNNLVEQDGAKVLIVANEDEIIGDTEKVSDGKKVSILESQSAKYLKIKEKTIGDTIHFNADVLDTITSIIKSFKNAIFDKMLEEKDDDGQSSFARRIFQQMFELKCFNFRSLLYATQKMHEVICKFKHEYNLKFVQDMFIGTVIYAVRINNGHSKDWDSKTYMSQTLGSYAYPFYKVMYEYITHHTYVEKEFDDMEKIFLKSMDISETDEKLNVLFNFYTSDEKDLETTLDYIVEKLRADSDLVYDEYTRIANYLIAVKHEVGFNDKVDECLSLMLDNSKKAIDKGQKVSIFIRNGLQLLSEDQAKELQSFINKINDYQKNSKVALNGFTYNPDELETFYNSIISDERTFIQENGFANKLDSSKFALMVANSSAKQIESLRIIFKSIYLRFSNVKDCFSCDLASLKDIKMKLIDLDDSQTNFDRIQKLQLDWLISDLEEIIDSLEN